MDEQIAKNIKKSTLTSITRKKKKKKKNLLLKLEIRSNFVKWRSLAECVLEYKGNRHIEYSKIEGTRRTSLKRKILTDPIQASINEEEKKKTMREEAKKKKIQDTRKSKRSRRRKRRRKFKKKKKKREKA